MAFARGAVEGAKSIPIIGSFVELIDHAINGAEKALEAGIERARLTTVAQVDKSAALVDARSAAAAGLSRFATVEAGPELTGTLAAKRAQDEALEKLRAHSEAVKSVNDAALRDAEASITASNASIASATARYNAVELKRKEDVAKGIANINQKYADSEKKRIDQENIKQEEEEKKIQNKKLAEQDKEIAEYEKALKQEADLQEKRLAEVEKAAKKEADIQAKALKAQQDLEVRGMETRLEALQQSAEPSRADRLGELADKAANPLIQSGQTALGQFKFAGGSGNEVMQNAEQQLGRLEAIEGLQREMRDYQRRIADGIAA